MKESESEGLPVTLDSLLKEVRRKTTVTQFEEGRRGERWDNTQHLSHPSSERDNFRSSDPFGDYQREVEQFGQRSAHPSHTFEGEATCDCNSKF